MTKKRTWLIMLVLIAAFFSGGLSGHEHLRRR
jgi:hypothetical protein